jgi:hypothetical protein
MDDERVRQRAFEIWEREGRPEGRHDENWYQASRELEAEGDEGGQSPADTSLTRAAEQLGRIESQPVDADITPAAPLDETDETEEAEEAGDVGEPAVRNRPRSRRRP